MDRVKSQGQGYQPDNCNNNTKRYIQKDGPKKQ